MKWTNNYNILIILLSILLMSTAVSFYFIKFFIIISVIIILISMILILYLKRKNTELFKKIISYEKDSSIIRDTNKKIIEEIDYAMVTTDDKFNITEYNTKLKKLFEIEININERLDYIIDKIVKSSKNFSEKLEIFQNKNCNESHNIELIMKNNKIIKGVVFYKIKHIEEKREYIFLFKDCTEERENYINLEILINNVDYMIGIYDSEMRVLRYNAAYKNFIYDYDNIEIYPNIKIIDEFEKNKSFFWNNLFKKSLNEEKIIKELSYVSKNEKDTLEIEIEITAIYNSIFETTGFIVCIKDISKKKIMEKKILNLKTELENLKNLDKDLFNKINTEFRPPLKDMINGVEIIKSNFKSQNEFEMIETVKESGKYLLSTLNDMEDYVKIETGKMDLNIEVIDIKKEIMGIIFNFEKIAIQKSIDIKLITNNEINQFIICDKLRFNQIITNIINYSIKFAMPQIIEISIEEIEDKYKLKSEYIISIKEIDFNRNRDNTAIDDVENIKLEKSIGVSVVEKIINLLGGKLSINYDKNIGTEFKMEFYFEKSEINSGKKLEKSLNSLERKKVLIVEDNRMNQIVMEKLLKIIKVNSDIAENGAIAFEKYKINKYDLILMDIQMPIMNGYETARKIREYEIQSIKKTPIIALTAYAMQSDREKCIEAGMDDYMSKPVMKIELFEMLKKYIKIE